MRGSQRYIDKIKEISNKVDSLEGCKNRMCVTDDREELFKLFSFLVLYASDLYYLNLDRLNICKFSED